jgi:hypothetical protein
MQMTRKMIAVMALMGTIAATGALAEEWKYSKNEEHPKGAKKVEDLKKEGDYYIVTGADMHNLAADLIGKKIRFRGYASQISRFPASTLWVLSEDKTYFYFVYFGDTMTKTIPEDFKTRLNNNGVRAAGGVFDRYDGDKLTLYCTLGNPCKEGGLTGNAAKYKACQIFETQKWEKGWTEPSTSAQPADKK